MLVFSDNNLKAMINLDAADGDSCEFLCLCLKAQGQDRGLR